VNLTWTTHSLLESGLEAGHPRKESPASEPVQ
jgi:hypothetical protein